MVLPKYVPDVWSSRGIQGSIQCVVPKWEFRCYCVVFRQVFKIWCFSKVSICGVQESVQVWYSGKCLSNGVQVRVDFIMWCSRCDFQISVQDDLLVFMLWCSCFNVKIKVVWSVLNRLGYFERKNTFYNQSQLTSQMGRHYAGQAIKQLYVLVLGLDVLGNPFGLLRGMAEGMEDLFYEPYQVSSFIRQNVENNWLGYDCCWACILVINKPMIQYLLMCEGLKISHP